MSTVILLRLGLEHSYRLAQGFLPKAGKKGKAQKDLTLPWVTPRALQKADGQNPTEKLRAAATNRAVDGPQNLPPARANGPAKRFWNRKGVCPFSVRLWFRSV
mmetsp:Transcript_15110/g.30630  ORF Transcript_15110/g.30630 Transcript_15110/m.30630 type:complete len:103 (-) Transcript_15110:595-903(-)